MDRQIILLSFADSRYAESLKRLEENTEKFPFTKRVMLTEKDLPQEFLSTVRYRLHRRGFGYWKWKPFIVAQQMENMNEGDILFYSDAGCYWNKKGILRFNDYLALVEQSPSGILAFEHPFLEKDWTKGDLLNYFDVYDNPSYTMTLQFASGLFALRKCNDTIEMIAQWNEIYSHHYDLVTDKVSVKPNLLGFCENRHDQSVLSLLFKQRNHETVSWQEIETLDNQFGDSMERYPVQCRRLITQEQLPWKTLRRKLTYPYRYIIVWWLKNVEHFQIVSRKAF